MDLVNKTFGNLLVLYPIMKYNRTYWMCKCNCEYGETIEVRTDGLLNGQVTSCKACKVNWLYNAGDIIHNDKQNIRIVKRIYPFEIRKKYEFECNVCGCNGQITEADIIRGYRCPYCINQRVFVGYNDVATTHPEFIKYFPGGITEAQKYTAGSDKKIYPVCPDCGEQRNVEISINRIVSRHSIGCSCGDGYSIPHKFTRSVLIQAELDIEEEYAPKWLIDESGSQRRFDFRIINHNIILEIDGKIGHGKTEWHNTKEESLTIDRWKENRAIENNFIVLRVNADISSLEYLRDNLVKVLKDYFDLSNVDFNVAYEYALSNKAKEVWEYYENHKPITATQVAIELNMCIATICRYLQTGTDLKKCNYDKGYSKSLAIEKVAKNAKERCSKRVQVYKDGKPYGIYPSTCELERRSLTDFGIKFLHTAISQVANGLSKHHHGFIFKYVC